MGYGRKSRSGVAHQQESRMIQKAAFFGLWCWSLAMMLSLQLTLRGETSTENLSTMKTKAEALSADVLDAEALAKAAALYEEILARHPTNLDAGVNFSRICWSLGNLESDKKKQKEWFTKGRDIAETLMKDHPNQPDGYYWHGVNYGEWVDRSSIFRKIGAKKVIMDDMNKVLSLNDKYDSGGAYIVVGRINYLSPGGSYEKAIECYEKAIEIGPARTTAYLFLGELYLHEHVFEKAEKNLKKVLGMGINKRYAIEWRDDRKTAERLFKKLDKKDDRYPEQETLTGH